ncbi:MAG: hypothetical protein ACYC2R_15230 [Burkholderiales bacterium]
MIDYENRNIRRIPIICELTLKVPETQETFHGTTKNLSVDDISFESDYVPRHGQLLEVTVAPPDGSTTQPLCAVVQVYKCTQVENETKRYEVGGAIRKILQ